MTSDRRTRISEAGARILATRGAHALTHLNIDSELGLPRGSTSYYARTRHDLIALVAEHLASRTSSDIAEQTLPTSATPESIASLIASGLETTLQRADDHRARLLLLLECGNDPSLQRSLATRAEVRSVATHRAAALLTQLSIENPDAHAIDLVALMDALLMQSIIRTAPINARSVLTAYLHGLSAPKKGAHSAARASGMQKA